MKKPSKGDYIAFAAIFMGLVLIIIFGDGNLGPKIDWTNPWVFVVLVVIGVAIKLLFREFDRKIWSKMK